MIDNLKLNNQYWFATTIHDFTILCGYGLILDEFILDTIEKSLTYKQDFYIFDKSTEILYKNDKKGYISDFFYKEDPNESSFCIVPKNDIIKTYYKTI